MANTMQSENAHSQQQPDQTEPKRGISLTDKLVVIAIVVGITTLVIYQLFFCPTCYVGGGRIVG